MNKPLEKYGAETLGRLRTALLNNPEPSIRKVTEINRDFYLFDKVPDYDRYIDEHLAYRRLLSDSGVEVIELSDLIQNNRELMTYLPNLSYLNDSSVVTRKGAILSSMCPGGRQYEELVVREALSSLGIPVLYGFEPGEQFEGFIPLSSDTVFVVDTERHKKNSIDRFISFALQHFKNIIYAEVPQLRRFMHPDMVFNLISDALALVYPPAFINCWLISNEKREEIDFTHWLKKIGIEAVPVSDEEQKKWGTSFIQLEPNHVINYDISLKPSTQKALEAMGVRFTQFHPEALLAGGGSLRCLTLRLLVE